MSDQQVQEAESRSWPRSNGLLTVEPRQLPHGGWYVYWNDDGRRAHGAIGQDLTQEQAETIAERILDGKVMP